MTAKHFTLDWGSGIWEIHSGYWLYPRASCGWFFFAHFCIVARMTGWLVEWPWPGCVHCDWHGKWYSHYAQDMLLSTSKCRCVCVYVSVWWLNRKRKWQQALCAVPLGAICICILHICCLFSHWDCH